MAENEEVLTGEELEKAIAAAEAEYDENRVVEKAEYVETDEKYSSQADAADPEPMLSLEEEFPDYVLPLGLQPTFIRGTNRYHLTGIIGGYAVSLIIVGLLGIAGIYENQSSMTPTLIGLAVGYVIGHFLTKRKQAEVDAELERMRAERDAAKAAE